MPKICDESDRHGLTCHITCRDDVADEVADDVVIMWQMTWQWCFKNVALTWQPRDADVVATWR
jgi:hypothetical protein